MNNHLPIYEIDEQKAFAECSVLQFESTNEAWLDFVSENRSGNYTGKTYAPLQTDLYALLEQEDTKLWHFSSLTLFNMFDEEKKTGSSQFLRWCDYE